MSNLSAVVFFVCVALTSHAKDLYSRTLIVLVFFSRKHQKSKYSG